MLSRWMASMKSRTKAAPSAAARATAICSVVRPNIKVSDWLKGQNQPFAIPIDRRVAAWNAAIARLLSTTGFAKVPTLIGVVTL